MPPELSADDVNQIRRQNTLARDQQRRLAEWGEKIDAIAARLDLLEMAVREASEDEANAIRELKGQVKRLEELELLRQMGRGDSQEASGRRGQITAEHSREHLQELLLQVVKDLQRAELRRARLGGRLDLELENLIEELTAAKSKIEAELNSLP